MEEVASNETILESFSILEESLANGFVSRKNVGAEQTIHWRTIEKKFAEILADAGTKVKKSHRGSGRRSKAIEERLV